jgi:hypothetical protein
MEAGPDNLFAGDGQGAVALAPVVQAQATDENSLDAGRGLGVDGESEGAGRAERRGWAGRIGVVVLVLAVFAWAIPAGLHLRAWAWEQTRPIRFHSDLGNAVKWGSRVVNEAKSIPVTAPRGSWRAEYGPLWRAYVGLYDEVAAHHPEGHYNLDYPPLRLLIATLWVRHIQALPGGGHAPWEDAAIAPMLQLNTALELVSVLAGFCLVFYWVRREQTAGGARIVPEWRRLARLYARCFGAGGNARMRGDAGGYAAPSCLKPV